MKKLALILDIFLLILVLPFGASTAKAAAPGGAVITVTTASDIIIGVSC